MTNLAKWKADREAVSEEGDDTTTSKKHTSTPETNSAQSVDQFCEVARTRARTQRHTDTQTHKHTQTHTDTQTHRHTHTQRHTETTVRSQVCANVS